MFIEFTRKSGTPVAVNSDLVTRVSSNSDDETYIYLSGDTMSPIVVREDYGGVVTMLQGK